MRVRLAFQQAVDERFLVLWESLRSGSFTAGQGPFSVAIFDDENDFIQQVVLADLGHEDTVSIIAAVLLALSESARPEPWIAVTLTSKQFDDLRLAAPFPASPPPRPKLPGIRDGQAELHDIMMQTPTPFVVMNGPEHRIVFINPAYIELIRRPSAEGVLGMPVREAIPELAGQAFLGLLDQVYCTGVEYVGREVPGQILNPQTGRLEKHLFDFIYYPIRDAHREVCGIMSQATDVTVNVLVRQVSESREEQLYKQWVQLDNIYRYSPLAMVLIRARDFTILRINTLSAEQLGEAAEDLIGKKILDYLPGIEELPFLYNLVLKGEVIRNFEISLELPPNSGVIRTWLLTLSPLFAEDGSVEMIESIATEISDRLEANPHNHPRREADQRGSVELDRSFYGT